MACDVPRVNPHQINTCESKPTDARYLSPGDQATSVTSRQSISKLSQSTRKGLTTFMTRQSFEWLPPLKVHFIGPPDLTLGVSTERGNIRMGDLTYDTGITHGSRSHIIIIASSLPLANHLPECAHLTVNTGPVCIARVHSNFGGRPESSESLFKIGFVLHILILASRPPVAIREQSGWT